MGNSEAAQQTACSSLTEATHELIHAPLAHVAARCSLLFITVKRVSLSTEHEPRWTVSRGAIVVVWCYCKASFCYPKKVVLTGKVSSGWKEHKCHIHLQEWQEGEICNCKLVSLTLVHGNVIKQIFLEAISSHVRDRNMAGKSPKMNSFLCFTSAVSDNHTRQKCWFKVAGKLDP